MGIEAITTRIHYCSSRGRVECAPGLPLPLLVVVVVVLAVVVVMLLVLLVVVALMWVQLLLTLQPITTGTASESERTSRGPAKPNSNCCC
jgi:hypothetical protein